MKLFSSNPLDLESLSKKFPLVSTEGNGIKIDHLHFIVHCIMKQRANNDDDQLKKIGKKDGFVPLHSKILESKVPNYHDAIRWLIDADVIECDEKYRRGKVSLGYRLKSPYRGNQLKRVEITDFILCKKIKQDKPFYRQSKLTKELTYLVKWFNSEKLDIDEQAALNWINKFEIEELQKINSNKSLKPAKRSEQKQNLFEKCVNYKILVSLLKEKDYFHIRDPKGKRFHSNLTNLPKGLRQFITYDGQELVSIDIKNCQPFLCLAFLNKEFWQSQILPEKVTLKKISNEIYKETGKNKKEKNNSIKFGISSQNLAQLDIQKMQFVKSVTGGTFYEWLVSIFENKYGWNLGATCQEKRNKMKKLTMLILFDNENEPYNKLPNSAMQIFKNEFVSIAQIFSFIKRRNMKTWPLYYRE
jgi:hypothetical protein